MLLDALLSFVPVGGNLSLVAGAGVDIPSNVIDLLGTGQGTAPQNIIGNRALFGEDSGLGAVKPQVQVNIGTSLATGSGGLLNVKFQAALDLGTPTYLPDTWRTLIETGAMAVADLVAGTVCARFDWPPAFPVSFQPRYLRLLFSPGAGANFTAGVVASAVVTMVRDDMAMKYAPRNYTVATH